MSEAKNVRTLQGKVVSDKMDKTVTVLVERKLNTLCTVKLFVYQLKSMLMMKTINMALVM